jgi:hypothetical protein
MSAPTLQLSPASKEPLLLLLALNAALAAPHPVSWDGTPEARIEKHEGAEDVAARLVKDLPQEVQQQVSKRHSRASAVAAAVGAKVVGWRLRVEPAGRASAALVLHAAGSNSSARDAVLAAAVWGCLTFVCHAGTR